MELNIVPAYDHAEEIGTLFAEYTRMLLENEPAFQSYLDLQNYEEELKHLEHKYGLPDGRLYLVFCDGEVAGSIGLRKLDDKNCEIKRLYVKPKFRGQTIGRLLVEKIINDAKEIGYAHILLDTFAFLESAIRIYKSYGFYEVESYNNSPMDNLIYLKLDL